MTYHGWDDLGPVLEGAGPKRGRRWSCPRCGMRIRSNCRPIYDLQGLLYVDGPQGPFRPGPERQYPSDCDVALVRSVMVS